MEGSSIERINLLKLGLKNIYIYPFGVGLGNTTKYYFDVYGSYKLSHNDFLSVFIETGIFGLIFYLSYFATMFLRIDGKGKVVVLVTFLYLNTLSCYNYESILPIVFAILLGEIRNKKLRRDSFGTRY